MGTGYRRRGVVVLMALASLLASMMVVAQPAATAAAAPRERIGIAYGAWGDPWSEDVAEGVARAANEYKLKVFDEFLIDARGRQTDPGDVVTKLVRKNPSLVLAVGFSYTAAVGTAAAANPATSFAVIDDVPPLASNSQGVLFATNEGSFLVGAAAALTSTSKQVGFIGGVDWPVIKPFEAGFAAGVEYTDPGTTLEVAYVGSDGGGFGDPETAYQIAWDMYASGIDVIYGAAGGSTIGILQAARDYSAEPGNQKVWMIGVDYDYYEQVDDSLKPFVLTSMIKRVDVAAYETIKAQVTGTFSGGGIEFFDLARDGVDYATSGGYVDDLVPTLEGLRQDIIDGVIVVPDM